MRIRLAVLGCLVACSEAEVTAAPEQAPSPVVAQVSGAINGGYEDGKTANVVGMVSLSGWGFGICSGSLIAPNVILTARHCVAPVKAEADGGGVDCTKTYFGEAHDPAGLYVTTDARMSQKGDYFAAAEIIVPEDTAFCGNDIALMILTENVPSSFATPLIPRVDEVVHDTWPGSTPDIYSAVGYGEAADGQGDSGQRRRRDDLQASCIDDHCPWYSSVTAGEWAGEAGVCQGDSGGPAIDALNRVIGVASRGAPGCGYPVYGGVFAWADLIKSTVLDAAKRGNYAPPTWATGWPTDPTYSFSVGLPCALADDCASGLCYQGYCSRMCIPEAPCGSSFECHKDLGICAARLPGGVCTSDTDCDGPCVEGVCSRGCNGASLHCPKGFACEGIVGRTSPDFMEGFCVIGSVGGLCSEAAECHGGACVQGACTRGCSATLPCPGSYFCDGTDQCALVGVGNLCQSDGQCPGGSCANGACTRACALEIPCPSTHACADGQCAAIPFGQSCGKTSECGGGECAAGFCTAICTEDTDCIAGYSCVDPTTGPKGSSAGSPASGTAQKLCTLIPAGDTCQRDTDCEGGTCESEICTRQCSAAAPCGDGTTCDVAIGKCLIPKEELAGAASSCSTSTSRSSRHGLLSGALLLLALVALRRRV